LNEIGIVRIYKDNEGIRLVLSLHEELITRSRLEGVEGSGETLIQALEDLYISADLIGE
jgi:hypothetical protein